jgi:hypothetical protein
MTGIPVDDRPLNIRAILGLGLDGRRDDVRITRGRNFYLLGGSKRTHERMVEAAVRFNDEVDRRGKSLPEISSRELLEISRELGDGV